MVSSALEYSSPRTRVCSVKYLCEPRATKNDIRRESGVSAATASAIHGLMYIINTSVPIMVTMPVKICVAP